MRTKIALLFSAALLPAALLAGPTPKPGTPKPPPKKPSTTGTKIDAVEIHLKGLSSKEEILRQKSADGLVKLGASATAKLLEARKERRELSAQIDSILERIWDVPAGTVADAFEGFAEWDPEKPESDASFWKAILALKGKAAKALEELSKEPGPKGQAARAAVEGYRAAAKGEGIFLGKGRCDACHKVGKVGNGAGGPNLEGIGKAAEERAHQVFIVVGRRMTGTEYLVESLVDPDGWVPAGYPKGTHPDLRGEKGALSDDEIRSLVAYLQSLGGKPDPAAITIPAKKE